MVDFNKIQESGVYAQVSKNARAMPNAHSGIGFFGEFYLKPVDGPVAAQVGVDILNADPAKLETIAATTQVHHTEEMRKEVARGASKVYEKTTPDYVEQTAISLIPDKNYRVLSASVETGRNIGGTLAAVNGNTQTLSNIIAIATSEAIKDAAGKDVIRRRKAELIKGKVIDQTTHQVNMANGSLYCVKEINKLAPKEQAAYHTDVGFTYTAIKDPTHFQ